ncbi:MAG: 3-phosphoserine/phosphohydroxythreonine transaminase [Planctomycetota bacterium]
MSNGGVEQRIYNFSPGPAVLPLPVLQQAQRDLVCLPGQGLSILEMSHRDQAFLDILADAQQSLRDLLGIPAHYRVLFLQGGSRLQFSMVPMNLLRGAGQAADYVLTGTWGKTALKEAQREGEVRVAWDGQACRYNRLPQASELTLNPNAPYVHVTSNETIEGVQFLDELNTGSVPLVCDASSDFLCRPLPIERYGMIYACAQKNAGPAGVTVVIIREDLLARSPENLPGYLNYNSHASENSLWNTPPTFAIYLLGLVAHWLRDEVGGLAKMLERNREKAALLYELLDAHPDFYRGHAEPGSRSLMNVTFQLPDAATEKAFLTEAPRRGLGNLKGHRSVGGIRASIYNAMPPEGVVALRDFMREFRRSN